MGFRGTSQSTHATDLGTAATAATYATLNDPGLVWLASLLERWVWARVYSLSHHARTQVQAYTTLRNWCSDMHRNTLLGGWVDCTVDYAQSLICGRPQTLSWLHVSDVCDCRCDTDTDTATTTININYNIIPLQWHGTMTTTLKETQLDNAQTRRTCIDLKKSYWFLGWNGTWFWAI